jgi:hypothetical protein
MTLALRTNVYNDSLCECFSRHSLEPARMTWASRLGTPRPLSLAIALIVGLMVFGVAHQTKAEESGHRLHHDNDYRHWKQPGTSISCCSDHDCAPVKAELRHGQWFALRETERNANPDELGQYQWFTLRLSEWIPVPDEKIIWVRNPTVEGGHLCYSRGMVVCFLPPNTGG